MLHHLRFLSAGILCLLQYPRHLVRCTWRMLKYLRFLSAGILHLLIRPRSLPICPRCLPV
jgi:hypothetical protein